MALLGIAISPPTSSARPPPSQSCTGLQYFELKEQIDAVDRPAIVWVLVRPDVLSEALSGLKQLGFSPSPVPGDDAPNFVELRVNPFDWKQQWTAIKSIPGVKCIESEYFRGVRGGSDAAFIILPSRIFPEKGNSTVAQRISKVSNLVVRSLFSGLTIQISELNTSIPNVKRYEIVGLSKYMVLKKRDTWERYKIELTYFPTFCRNKSIVALDFEILDQRVATFREDAQPPDGRYEEADDASVNRAASLLSAAVATKLGGLPHDWHESSACQGN
jgi:hypothetical protein